MASQFTIDTKKFVDQSEELHLPSETPGERFKRLTLQRDIDLVEVEKYIKNFDSVERPLIKRLRTVEKVIYVAIAIVLLLTPLGFSFLPFWLPAGVGFPTFLIFSHLRTRVKKKIEGKEQCYDALLKFRDMLNQHSFKALHQFGEWDLPPVDRRLKSDLLMQEELNKRHPVSAYRIERLVASLDLDMTSSIQWEAASKLAQFPDKTADWGEIKEKVREAKELLHKGELEAYKLKMADARKTALLVGKSEQFKEKVRKDEDFVFKRIVNTSPSAKDQLRAVIGSFQYFNQLYQELYRTHEEGRALYGSDFCEQWNTYLEFANQAYDKITKITSLFEKTDTGADEWLSVAQDINRDNLQLGITSLIEWTRLLNRVIRAEISNHPVVRLEEFKSLFAMYDKKILQEKVVDDLRDWICQNPEEAKRPIGEVMKVWDFSDAKEVKEWIEAHEEWAVDPVIEIYKRNQLMRSEYKKAWSKAVRRFSTFFKEKEATVFPEILTKTKRREEILQSASSPLLKNLTQSRAQENGSGLTRAEWEERQQLSIEIALLKKRFTEQIKSGEFNLPSKDQIARFNREVILPLRKAISNGGESSSRAFWKALTRKFPARPFDPVNMPKDDGFAKGRKIEELVINDLLKKVDREMILSNQIRRYGLEWLAISALWIFVVIFGSNLWVAWGISSSMLAIHGLSLYIDYKLRKLDKDKQELKIQMLLRDYPLITQVPDSRPGLKDLREVQGKSGIDGLTRTRARIYAKGDDLLQVPRSLGEAMAISRNVAVEGSEEARPPIENRLLLLRSQRVYGDYRHEDEIKELVELLYPPLESKEKSAPKQINILVGQWNHAVAHRKRMEKNLDQISQEITLPLQEQLDRYDPEKREENISQRLREIDRLGCERDYQIKSYLLELVRQASLGEHQRAANEGLEEILEEMKSLADEIYEQNSGNSEKMTHSFSTYFRRLASFPVERLQSEIKKLEADCLQMIAEIQMHERLRQLLDILARIEEGKKLLSEARANEKIEEVLVALERQLLLLDPKLKKAKEGLIQARVKKRSAKELAELERELLFTLPLIEEKRQALIKDIDSQGDKDIQGAMRKNLEFINTSLCEAKKRLASALIQASKDPINGFENDINGLKQQLDSIVKQKLQSPKRAALEGLFKLAKEMLDQELVLTKAFREQTLCSELKDIVTRSSDCVIPFTPTIQEQLDTLLSDSLWEEHLDNIRELYLSLNSYQKASTWWRLPGVLRIELRRSREESIAESVTAEIRLLFSQLRPIEQEGVFEQLPHPFRVEFLRDKAECAKIELERLIREGKWDKDKKNFRYFFWQMNKERRDSLFKMLPPEFQKEIIEDRSLRARDALEKILAEKSSDQTKIQRLYRELILKHKKSIFNKLPLAVREELV
ncbi:MAG: hypothetical protein JJU12_01760 [Chlamydiales bacterium]|nr:hypothetical protein [Chlamydiales bacterium]